MDNNDNTLKFLYYKGKATVQLFRVAFKVVSVHNVVKL